MTRKGLQASLFLDHATPIPHLPTPRTRLNAFPCHSKPLLKLLTLVPLYLEGTFLLDTYFFRDIFTGADNRFRGSETKAHETAWSQNHPDLLQLIVNEEIKGTHQQ